MKTAAYWKPLPDKRTICELCPHRCRLSPGQTGLCRSRKNIDGSLIAINYGEVCSINIDPIEKKPLYHFLPGSPVLSLGNNGCNLACAFCQNWQIAQETVPTKTLMPDQLLTLARDHHSPSVAFTYAEPMIWFEYIRDAAALLKQHGIRTILVTNGMILPDPLDELLPRIDAMNIDIKSMSPRFYQQICHGDLDTVLHTAAAASRHAHVEITNLVVTGENDSDDEFHRLGRFIAENLSRTTPLHLSRYHPAYRMTNPPTPMATLLRARKITGQYLDHVFLGNITDSQYSHTICPNCGAELIHRTGYSTMITGLDDDGACSGCGHTTGIVR